VQTSGLVGADYACTTVCEGDWRQCLRLTEDTENYGSRLPKVELPFVVDGMAGVLRFALRSAPPSAFIPVQAGRSMPERAGGLLARGRD
jgi:hypothetical protein